MSLTAGIVGLPNVGKSTLFNAITKSSVLSANYPFATIEPNVGVVRVPDSRLKVLSDIVNPKQVVPTIFEFTDIAGIVRGASKGEGLGNQFLSHIREVDAIIHVVRAFQDGDITHVDGSVDPIRDIETINIELALADLDVVQKRLPKIEKKAQLKIDKDAVFEYEILLKIKKQLEKGDPIRSLELVSTEKAAIKHYNFLTSKPMLYVANVDEDNILNSNNDLAKAVSEYALKESADMVVISAKIESEIAQLDHEEQAMFLEELGLESSGLDQLIHASYHALGLKTFFTAGEKEVRAWTFKDGMSAPQCAGVIHTDFEKGFIKAATISFDDYVAYRGEQGSKEAGKLRLEGKEYVVKDGDVIHFRFNV
jgi:GTP-binding protein YchF